MTFSVFGTKPSDAIYLPDAPYSIRNDCSLGRWKVGDDDYRTNQLEMSIIRVSKFFGSLGKATNIPWLQIWFIPVPGCKNFPQNTVCVTYLKTRSVSHFSQRVTELMESGEPALGIFVGSFEKHSNDAGTYYSVKWGWRERQGQEEADQLQMIEDFLAEQPPLIDLNGTRDMICVDGWRATDIVALIEARTQPLLTGG